MKRRFGRVIITPPFWRWDGLSLCWVYWGLAGFYVLYKFRTRLKDAGAGREEAGGMRQVQLQFFTNVFARIRTPLTLILARWKR